MPAQLCIIFFHSYTFHFLIIQKSSSTHNEDIKQHAYIHQTNALRNKLVGFRGRFMLRICNRRVNAMSSCMCIWFESPERSARKKLYTNAKIKEIHKMMNIKQITILISSFITLKLSYNCYYPKVILEACGSCLFQRVDDRNCLHLEN